MREYMEARHSADSHPAPWRTAVPMRRLAEVGEGLGAAVGGGGEEVGGLPRVLRPHPEDAQLVGGDLGGGAQVGAGGLREVHDDGGGLADFFGAEAHHSEARHPLGHLRGGEGGRRAQFLRLGDQPFGLSDGGGGHRRDAQHLALEGLEDLRRLLERGQHHLACRLEACAKLGGVGREFLEPSIGIVQRLFQVVVISYNSDDCLPCIDGGYAHLWKKLKERLY